MRRTDSSSSGEGGGNNSTSIVPCPACRTANEPEETPLCDSNSRTIIRTKQAKTRQYAGAFSLPDKRRSARFTRTFDDKKTNPFRTSQKIRIKSSSFMATDQLRPVPEASVSLLHQLRSVFSVRKGHHPSRQLIPGYLVNQALWR